ncbi:DUF732 domain-containing protein [Mycobacterium hodleri]|uniref:DUF732 domain-containing protein n=1 Tax=Mycolicibacterium hodleri TaxID=49897 RepID=UPI0021F2A54E|nr:DUF732 domain-containing protein [Mycolicibacterium hodleri]MCV7133922.1 DUF732 domain-containing protein [Mycolicibacterium hodleri]
MSCFTGDRKLTMGFLIALAAVAMSAAAPTSAHADTGTDPVLNTVGTAGASTTGASASPSLGTSICAAIQQPGETMASIASALAARDGTSPRMSRILTGLSVSIYCPTMMSTLPGDDWLNLLGAGS